MVEEFNLKDPFPNGFLDQNDPVAVNYITLCQKVFNLLQEGNLYIKFVDGDRKGSIARVSPDRFKYRQNCPHIESGRVWTGGAHPDQYGYRFRSNQMYGVCSWDGRRNKVSVVLPSRDIVFLINYQGPTVWQKFDAKAAKAAVLEDPDQYDIDGNKLAIGDKVLYMNLRYGAGGMLQHGTIQEFKAVVDSKRTKITTIVKNDRADEVSELRHPDSMVYKKPQI